MELGRMQNKAEDSESTGEQENADEEEEQTVNAMQRRNRLSPEQVEEYKRMGKCFSCGKHGHLSRHCPNRIKPQAQKKGS